MKKLINSTTSLLRAAVLLTISLMYAGHAGASSADSLTAAGQDVVGEESALTKGEAKKVTELITADYINWNKASISGKLKTDMLPIPVTLRMDMEKNKRLSVSLRAMFIGEAFRIEMTPGNLYLINKRAKTYYQLEYDAERPLLEYAQSTLLGRIVLPEDGELSKSNFSKCLFYALGAEEGNADMLTGYAVVPPTFAENFRYGYTVNADYLISDVVVAISEKLANAAVGSSADKSESSDQFVDVAYVDIEYAKSGKAKARIHVGQGKYEFVFNFECSEPEYGAKLLEPVELTDEYKSVSLKEVLRF